MEADLWKNKGRESQSECLLLQYWHNNSNLNRNSHHVNVYFFRYRPICLFVIHNEFFVFPFR